MGFNKLLLLILVVGCLLCSYSSPSFSANYFKCSAGYTFQTNGNDSARCFKPEGKEYRRPNSCPKTHVPIINKSVGHFLKKNHQGIADKCVGKFKVGSVSNENVLDLTCPAGYLLEIRSGVDRCSKTIKAKAISPSVARLFNK